MTWVGVLTLLFFVWMFSMWMWCRQMERRIDKLAEGLRLSVDMFAAMQKTDEAHQAAILGILDVLGKLAK